MVFVILKNICSIILLTIFCFYSCVPAKRYKETVGTYVKHHSSYKVHYWEWEYYVNGKRYHGDQQTANPNLILDQKNIISYDTINPKNISIDDTRPVFFKEEKTEITEGTVIKANNIFEVFYTYKVNNKEFKTSQTLYKDDLTIKAGDKIKVEYLLKNPKRAIIILDKPTYEVHMDNPDTLLYNDLLIGSGYIEMKQDTKINYKGSWDNIYGGDTIFLDSELSKGSFLGANISLFIIRRTYIDLNDCNEVIQRKLMKTLVDYKYENMLSESNTYRQPMHRLVYTYSTHGKTYKSYLYQIIIDHNLYNLICSAPEEIFNDYSERFETIAKGMNIKKMPLSDLN